LLDAPVVESASKRRQSIEDAPGAVTVISAEDLTSAGPLSLSEALRIVPGMWIFQTDANSFHVGLRGVDDFAGAATPLVLVNGRRFFDAVQQIAPWPVLGLNVNEIERIEVLRGPGAPLHGADALNGVINIVTKRARDQHGVEGSFVTGTALLAPDDSPVANRAETFGQGYLAANFGRADRTLSGRASVAFNHLPEWQPDPQPQAGQDLFRQGPVGWSGSLSLEWNPTSDLAVRTEVHHSVSESHTTFLALKAAPVLWEEQAAMLSLEKTRFVIEPLTLKVNADVRRLVEGSTLFGTGADFPTSMNYSLSAQGDLAPVDGRNILTAGLEASYRDGHHVFEQSWSAAYAAAMVQNETAFLDRKLLLNVAARYEAIRLRGSNGQGPTYVNLNPRLSIIGRLGPSHTVRLSAATSYRTPPPFLTLIEAVPTYYPPPIPPAYAVARNQRLRPEQLRSVEAGYRGRPAYWMRLDGTVFVQQAVDLDDTTASQLPIETDFVRRETHLGFELGAQFRPMASLSGHLSYSLFHARSPAAPAGTLRFPPHILAVGVNGAVVSRLRARADFNYIAATHYRGVSIDPTGTFIGTIQRHTAAQTILNLRLGYAMSTETEVFAMGTNVLAPLRNNDDLKQGASQESARIGAIFMIGVHIHP
jgi:outer membrane receptor protein involved in Fe transport